MALTDMAIRRAKPMEKQQKLFDSGGLFLLVTPAGGKRWVLKYRFGGREKSLAFGTYPEVSLVEARKKRDAAREKLAANIDPGEAKKAEKRTQRLNAENSFEAIAREWHAKYAPTWSDSHGDRILRRLEVDAFPWIGGKPMANLTPPDVLDILRRVEKRGALETAHRLRGNVGQVCRYAVATGRAERDVTSDLRGALPPPRNRALRCRHCAEGARRAAARYRQLSWHLPRSLRTQARPTSFSTPRRAARRRVGGIRPRRRHVGNSKRPHEAPEERQGVWRRAHRAARLSSDQRPA